MLLGELKIIRQSKDARIEDADWFIGASIIIRKFWILFRMWCSILREIMK